MNGNTLIDEGNQSFKFGLQNEQIDKNNALKSAFFSRAEYQTPLSKLSGKKYITFNLYVGFIVQDEILKARIKQEHVDLGEKDIKTFRDKYRINELTEIFAPVEKVLVDSFINNDPKSKYNNCYLDSKYNLCENKLLASISKFDASNNVEEKKGLAKQINAACLELATIALDAYDMFEIANKELENFFISVQNNASIPQELKKGGELLSNPAFRLKQNLVSAQELLAKANEVAGQYHAFIGQKFIAYPYEIHYIIGEKLKDFQRIRNKITSSIIVDSKMAKMDHFKFWEAYRNNLSKKVAQEKGIMQSRFGSKTKSFDSMSPETRHLVVEDIKTLKNGAIEAKKSIQMFSDIASFVEAQDWLDPKTKKQDLSLVEAQKSACAQEAQIWETKAKIMEDKLNKLESATVIGHGSGIYR